MSIMLPYPGLPQHFQVAIAPKQSNRSAMPFFRSCWSITPARVFKRDHVLPFLGVRLKSTPSRSSGGVASEHLGDDKKGAQFVVHEVFASSPLLEHGVAEGWVPCVMCELMACLSPETHLSLSLPPGDVVALIASPSLSAEVLLDGDDSTCAVLTMPVAISQM